MLATDKSQYFAQLRPISVKYAHLASTRFRIHSVFKNFHSGEPEQIKKVTDSYVEFTGYVWTWTFLNPERKSCGFKNIRIRL